MHSKTHYFVQNTAQMSLFQFSYTHLIIKRLQSFAQTYAKQFIFIIYLFLIYCIACKLHNTFIPKLCLLVSNSDLTLFCISIRALVTAKCRNGAHVIKSQSFASVLLWMSLQVRKAQHQSDHSSLSEFSIVMSCAEDSLVCNTLQ